MRLLLSLLAVTFLTGTVSAADFKAGTASKVITPTEPLAIEDGAGNRCLLLTSDLCGIPRSLSEPVCAAVTKQTGLKREQILLSCSHTHCGPIVRDNLFDMYDMPAD